MSKLAAINLTPEAYSVLFLHCCKHPTRTLNGLLLGTATAETVTVSQTLPLFHSSIAVAPMLEAALLLADEHCKQWSASSGSTLQIVGYYQANEIAEDLDVGPFGKKIAEKIRAQVPAAAVLLLDGASMRPTAGDLRLVSIGLDNKRSAVVPAIAPAEKAAQCLAQLDGFLARGLQHELTDFDVHLDDASKDWTANAELLTAA